jgi:hypothetical protein
MNTNNPPVRIPIQHLIWVKEFIQHGDAQKAYGKAYPKTKPQCLSAAASRLFKRPEIKQLVEEKQAEAMEKGFAAAEAEAAERYKQEFLSIYERRAELACIVRRQARMNKYYKFKEEVKTMDVPVDNPNAIMRAIELDAKLEAEYFSKKAIATARQEKKEEKKEEGKIIFYVYDEKRSFDSGEDLTDEELEFLLKESLTNPDVVVSPPTLTYMHEKLGCECERDMETGRYEIVCPGDKVVAKEVDGEIRHFGIRENPQPDLTIVNTDSPQRLEDQDIEKKPIKRQTPDDKHQIPDSNHQSRWLSGPNTIDEHHNTNEWQNVHQIIKQYVQRTRGNHSELYRQELLNMNKLYKNRNSAVNRPKLEELTGWEFHPYDNELVRRK